MKSEITANQSAKATERYKPHYTSEYTDDAWEVTVTIPGAKRDDISVTIENEILEIVATRSMDYPAGWTRHTGSAADRRYELRLDIGPEVDDSNIEASLNHGQLSLRLPLREEVKPRNIPIT